ncbi:MAG TPA: hypothetical protein VE223_07485 [Nitrososphaeraceae archaeon]|nr:hypothetical protein [Nitrososphaeraceae archaeon]
MGNAHSLIAAILIIGAGFLPPTVTTIANAQMMGPMASMFCNAVRAGVATGPQAGICGLFAQNQLGQSTLANGATAAGGTGFPCLPQFGCGTTATTTTNGLGIANSICASGFTFDPASGLCIPTSTTNRVCGVNFILQNGVCVPISQTQPTPPIANAGPDQTVTNGSIVILNGAGSTATTPGATITGYSWTQTAGPAVSLNAANTVTPTFIAPTVTTQTVLIFSLTVTDSNGQVSSPSTTQVTVNAR